MLKINNWKNKKQNNDAPFFQSRSELSWWIHREYSFRQRDDQLQCSFLPCWKRRCSYPGREFVIHLIGKWYQFKEPHQTNGLVQVAIGKDDEWRFPAQFEGRLFQIGIGAVAHHYFARLKLSVLPVKPNLRTTGCSAIHCPMTLPVYGQTCFGNCTTALFM